IEFAPNLASIVIAGVNGSKIVSELGNMRTSEQTDELEIMRINTNCYCIDPKILAELDTIPYLVVYNKEIGILGRRVASSRGGIVSADTFDRRLTSGFSPKNVWFGIIKAYTFAFIISSVSSFYGYYVKGGSLEIGRASTTAVITSCVLILFADYILA